MDLFVLIFALLVAWKMQPAKFNKDYVSITTGKALRGIFAIVVIFHHLTQCTEGGHFFRYFANAGFMAVGVFLFFSGYGLQKKYDSDLSYQEGFLLKRIPAVLIPYLVATIVYWGGYAVAGAGSSVTYMLTSIFSDHTMVANGWYVMNILAFYVFFCLLMLVCKRKRGLMVTGGVLFALLWAFFCIKMELGIWWYNATLTLGLGMFWAAYEEKILKVIEKGVTGFFLLSTAAFLVAFHVLAKVGSFLPGFYVPMERVVSILFIFMVLGFSMKFKVGNKVLYFIGDISYELYLIHGIWIYWFRYDFVYIENEMVMMVMVFAGSIVSAVVLHKISGMLLSDYKKAIKRWTSRN